MKTWPYYVVYSVFLLLISTMLYAAQPQWIFSMHDPGGEQHAVDKGKRLWIVFTEEIGHDPTIQTGRNYTQWSNAGHGVIVRLNNGYGSAGTLPYQSQYQNFATRCANYIKNSQGVEVWIIGNETNLPREWPGNINGSPTTGEPITVARYVDCYNKCYTAIKAVAPNAQLCPAPTGTWAPPYPAQGIEEFDEYWVNMLNGIGASKIDALAIHAYTHGCDPNLVFSEAKMGPPYTDIYYNFRVYKNYMSRIPASMRSKPVYITECDQNIECADPPPAPRYTWANTNSGWVRNIYSEINNWNSNPANQKIRCVTLFRWPSVAEGEWNFGIAPRQGVIDDWRMAMDNNYVWQNAVAITSGPSVSVTGTTATITWQTNIASTSRVDYGTTASYGSSVSDSTLVTSHSVTITGLVANTLYHYKVTSSSSGYVDGVTGDLTFMTAPVNKPFTNGGFETGALSPWVKYGEFDGVQSGNFFGTSAHSGTYFIGAAANWGYKNGGVYQRCNVNPGSYYRLKGWGWTWQNGGSVNNTSNRVKFGIDTGAGIDPYSASIIWTPSLSTQQVWDQTSLLLKATGSAWTVFADVQQDNVPAITWHVSAIDDISLTELPSGTIQDLKAQPNNTEVYVKERIVTAVFSSGFYIEEPNRQSGIRIAWTGTMPTVGSIVDVVGTLGITSSGERQITANTVLTISAGQ